MKKIKLSNKIKFLSNNTALILIVLGIFVFINLFALYFFGRLDLTQGKRYTISPATKEIISNLDDVLTIKLYASKKLPSDFQNIAQYTNDILSEYAAYSNKITVKKIDPADNEELTAQAAREGVPPIEMRIMEKDEFKVQKGYFGLALVYGEKKDAIPVLNQVDNLEYELTSKIIKITATQLKTVGFLTGHGEHIATKTEAVTDQAAQNDYSSVREDLEKIYNVKLVNLKDPATLDGVDTLIIAGPKQNISDDELLLLDQYILKGGRALMLIDNTQVSLDMKAAPNHSGIEKLTEHYGIKLEDNLILDESNNVVAFTSGQMQFLVNYSFWPKLLAENFDQSNQIFAKLGSISLPWLGSLSASPKDGLTVKILATTSNLSMTVTEPYNLDPQQTPIIKSQGKIPVIAESSGKFTTLFPDKKPALIESSGESKIIVVPESEFASDNYLPRFPINITFILNAVDYLTLDDALISIRAKTIIDRPIGNIGESTKTAIKVVNIIIIPLLVVAFGLGRYLIRKRIKK